MGHRIDKKRYIEEKKLHKGQFYSDKTIKKARLYISKDIARILGLSPSRWDVLSNGHEDVNREYLDKLEKIWGCRWQWLCGEDDFRRVLDPSFLETLRKARHDVEEQRISFIQYLSKCLHINIYNIKDRSKAIDDIEDDDTELYVIDFESEPHPPMIINKSTFYLLLSRIDHAIHHEISDYLDAISLVSEGDYIATDYLEHLDQTSENTDSLNFDFDSTKME